MIEEPHHRATMTGSDEEFDRLRSAIQSICRRGEVAAIAPEYRYDRCDRDEEYRDPDEHTCGSGDGVMKVPQKDEEAGEEESEGDLE